MEALDGREYDVILCGKLDGMRISAHRDDLSRSSPYFRGMFASKMKETTEKEIYYDIPGPILDGIVKYCHTGLTTDNIKTLMEAAQYLDYFQIDFAVDEGVQFMLENLCVDNWVDYRFIAERQCLQRFLKESLEFSDSFFDALRQRQDFYEMSMESMESVLKRDTLDCSNEEFVFDTIVKWYKRDTEKREKHMPDLLKLVHLPRLSRSFISSYLMDFCLDHCPEMMELASEFLSHDDANAKRSSGRMSGKIIAFNDTTIRVYAEKIKKWSTFTLGRYGAINALSLSDQWMDGITYYCPIYSDGFFSSLRQIKLWNKLATFESPSLLFDENTTAYWSIGENGNLYVVGFNGHRDPVREGHPGHLLNCYRYNMEEDSRLWTDLPNILKVREHISVAYMENYLYVVGAEIIGRSGRLKLHSPELPLCRYNSVTHEWEMCKPLNDNNPYFATTVAVAVNGLLFAIGVSTSIFEQVEHRQMFVYFYNPQTRCWKRAAPLDVSCQNIKACGTDTFLYIVVGPRIEIDERKRDQTTSKDFYRYDPKEDKWTKLESICSMYGTDDISLLDASNFL